jgi:hypothetical protein
MAELREQIAARKACGKWAASRNSGPVEHSKPKAEFVAPPRKVRAIAKQDGLPLARGLDHGRQRPRR